MVLACLGRKELNASSNNLEPFIWNVSFAEFRHAVILCIKGMSLKGSLLPWKRFFNKYVPYTIARKRYSIALITAAYLHGFVVRKDIST